MLSALRPAIPLRRLRPPTHPFRNSLHYCRIHHTSRKASLRRLRHTAPLFSPQPLPRWSAIDPFSLLISFALTTGLAYVALRSTSKDQSSQETSEESIVLAPSAHLLYPLTMAASMPPGRPGTLTAEQESKLKEMWAQTLEIFGVASEDHTNGTSTPSTAESTPEKKKKKGRLSMLRRKDKDDASDGGDNDKHGQTKEFQAALASQSPDALREAFWEMSKHDHPDALLLRFLRARKWDVQAALVMMISTLHWRMEEMHVDDRIMLGGEEGALKETKSEQAGEKKEGEDFMAQLRMGKSFLHGMDKEGRPCCWVRVRLHRQGEQSERSLERFTVYTIESARMMLRPPVDTATIVFDMTDFSMANMDYTPVKFMIKCFEANYPESLGSVLVYKSPWIFSSIWKIIKGWLDPVVASKVHFASTVDDLSEWIPKDRIMKELGGDEDWTYKYVEPVEGENKAMEDGETKGKILAERSELVKSYESETLAWCHGSDAGEGRNRLAERLAENYWRVDPYIRARSFYDRTGVIGEKGRMNFYPTSGQSSAAPAAGGGGGGDDDVD